MAKMWDRGNEEADPDAWKKPDKSGWPSWSRRHHDLIQGLLAWDFDGGNPGYPANSFLADMQRLVSSERPLTNRQAAKAQEALEDFERALTKTVAPDLDACPPGYDPGMWHLTLLFREEAAREQKIDLAEFSNILLYAKLERAISPFRSWFTKVPYRQVKVPDGPMPGYKVVTTWVDVMEAVIRYRFREYIEDSYAADRFCQPELFRDMVAETRERGRACWVRQRLDELPEREPEPRPRKKFKPWDGKGKRPRRLEPLEDEEL